jgi:hypothetical protein
MKLGALTLGAYSLLIISFWSILGTVLKGERFVPSEEKPELETILIGPDVFFDKLLTNK